MVIFIIGHFYQWTFLSLDFFIIARWVWTFFLLDTSRAYVFQLRAEHGADRRRVRAPLLPVGVLARAAGGGTRPRRRVHELRGHRDELPRRPHHQEAARQGTHRHTSRLLGVNMSAMTFPCRLFRLDNVLPNTLYSKIGPSV